MPIVPVAIAAPLFPPRGPDPWGNRSERIYAARAALRSRFTGMPEVHYGDAEHFVDGDTGISQWTIRGTSTAGQRVDVRGCDFYTFGDGKIVKKNSCWKVRQ
jgi:ketosteroid isomerase-like protein